MIAAISYLIAGVSTVGLVAVWLINAYQVLSHKKQDVLHAEEQVRLLLDCFDKMRNGPEEAAAGRMLETSIQIYSQVEKNYNDTLGRPVWRIPGLLLGFRKAEYNWESKEEKMMTYICEDCGFVFYGSGKIHECPYCGKQRIQASAEKATEQLQLITAQQQADYHMEEEQAL